MQEANTVEYKMELNDRLEQVKEKTTLDVIKQNPSATIRYISRVTGKSPRTIAREMKRYQDNGTLYREGARKKGKWLFTVEGYYNRERIHSALDYLATNDYYSKNVT